jgi:hypothetical protein
MGNFDPDPKAIGRRRRSTEACLARLLQLPGIELPLDVIQSIIFDYHHTSFKTYSAQMLALFALSECTIDEDVVLLIIEDAWNYPPHRSLDGRSPAEVMADCSRFGERQSA